MKKLEKHLSKILSSTFCMTIFAVAIVAISYTDKNVNFISTKVPFLFEESIKEYVNQKIGHFAPDIFVYRLRPDGPQIGDYETRTARYPDTTFKYRAKVVDRNTALFVSNQTALIDIKKFQVDSLHAVYNSLLLENNIHVKSVIGVTASFYTKLNAWTGDTTAINPDYRIVLEKQGLYEDIYYYAYVESSFLTLWKMMPQKLIYTLLTCNLLSVILYFGWLYVLRRRRKRGIVQLKDGNYRISNIIFDVHCRKLISDKKEIRVGPQLNELLLLLVESEEHKISKKEIQERFWGSNMDPVNNMTSAMNRLKTDLKTIGCMYTIYSDPDNIGYYSLSLISSIKSERFLNTQREG